MSHPLLAAIILTKNEERDLPGCLDSLGGLASEVYVVDSGSTDRTIEIARACGAKVLTHEFVNHASQFNWALDRIGTSAAWILRIDADERLSDELRDEIRRRLPSFGPEVVGVLVPLRTRFLGRALRWGATYPVWLLRLWRNGRGRCEDTWMDEHILLDTGEVRRLHGNLIHEIPKSLSEWTRKHIWYAERECQDILEGQTPDPRLTGQARLNRLLKHKLYLRLPPFYRAFLYWFYRYFVRMGLLDGKAGLIYHFLQAFWYRFFVDAMLHEIRRAAKSGGGAIEGVEKHVFRAEAS